MFFGTFISHSPFHMCAYTHKYCCNENPKRELWQETMEGLMFHGRHWGFFGYERRVIDKESGNLRS